jgi:magnesium-transporting ATPase (P-type)
MSRKHREPLAESHADVVGPFWAIDADALMAKLASQPQGLTQADASARLKRYGRNTVEDRRELSALRLLIRQFESPLALILVFGAAIALLLHELLDASIVILIVLGSCALGFLQEFNASRAVQALRERPALSVKVLRDGALTACPVIELVPGDVVELSAGNLVSAAGRILSARDFLVSESALTGESFPVEKAAGMRYRKVDEIPYDFQWRRLTVVVAGRALPPTASSPKAPIPTCLAAVGPSFRAMQASHSTTPPVPGSIASMRRKDIRASGCLGSL